MNPLIKVGKYYEWISPVSINIRSYPIIEFFDLVKHPKLKHKDLFVVLEAHKEHELARFPDQYDLRILTTDGVIGWLFLWDIPKKLMKEVKCGIRKKSPKK